MKVSTMRRVDRWLGTPACAALSLFRRLFGPGLPDRWVRPRRIAFLKLAEQGSTVLAYPALRRAAERVGRENVFFVLFEENRPILDLLEVIPPENVLAIPTGNLVRTLVGAAATIARLRHERVDTVVDLEFFARSTAALAYLSGARTRAGYHSYGGEGPYRGDLLTHRLSFNPYLHTTQTFQILVEALDHPAAEFPRFRLDPPPIGEYLPRARIEPGAARSVREKLRAALGGTELSPIVLLNANASDLLPLRRWPSERYVALARRILDHWPDAAVVFTGAPGERDAVGALVDAVGSPRCANMAGRTSLAELAALYQLAEVLVTNDSGPAHFASLTDAEVVVLFGPETPRLFAAPTPRTHPLWAGLACSPCVNAFNNRHSACQDNACMQAITVDRVFETVRGILARRGRAMELVS